MNGRSFSFDGTCMVISCLEIPTCGAANPTYIFNQKKNITVFSPVFPKVAAIESSKDFVEVAKISCLVYAVALARSTGAPIFATGKGLAVVGL